MAIPYRGNTGLSTYFITASTYRKKILFQSERMARLFVEVLFHYREREKYSLHEFVLMPDHFHLLITPIFTLEKALQLIKGGFSYRAKKELGFGGEVWEHSFYDHRVRDLGEYQRFRHYIRQPRHESLGECKRGIPLTVQPLLDLSWMKSLRG